MKCLYLFIILTVGAEGLARTQWPRCEKISSPICQHLGYNTTLMPNFAGHNTQQEASRGLQAFQPLLHYNCSQHLRLFVCSVFMPFCTEHVPGAVPACRHLCETVREDCLPVLERFLLPWPAELECSRFPAPPALCIQLPSTEDVEHHNSTFLSVDVSPTFSHCPPRFAAVDETCTPLCDEDAYYRSEDKDFTKVWTIIWSVICLVVTAFTILTFCVDKKRFRYPERPLLFLALCCLFYSGFVLVRTLVGPRAFICNGEHLATKSSDNILCAVNSFAMHYLAMASRMWWMIFCACWYLHAACEWSNEALIELAPWFHGVVYGISAIPALLAFATGHIAADELTGSCSIKEESTLWFVVVPHSLFLVIGSLLSLGTGSALIRVRRSLLAAGRGRERKLERLMIRLGVFTGLYVIPEIGYLVCTVYESWHRPWWKSLALLSALDCRNCSHEPMYHTASLQVVLLRILFSMLIGLASLMWVCSGKTCRTWVQLLHAPRKSMPITKV